MTSDRKKLYCSVFGCLIKSVSHPEMSFFSIPNKDPKRYSQWLRLIGREDLIDKPTSFHRVCEVHFNPQDILVKTHRKLLKNKSFPQLCLPDTNPVVNEGLTSATNSIQTVLVPSGVGIQTENPASIVNIKTEKCTVAIQTDEDSTQTTAASDTTRKRKLNDDLSQCEKRLKRQENQEMSTKSQLNMFTKLCDRFLSKDLAEIVKLQPMLNFGKPGNRYSLEYKMFCLNLYYVTPQAYRLLQNTLCLPSRATLNELYIPISTQINENLFSILKMKVDQMSEEEKNCTVVVDAMSLKANLFYDIKNDKIIGFHEVDGSQTPKPAKKALAVLVCGIFVNWYQPIGFALLSECKSDDTISQWIDKLILKLFSIGLKVRAFVSDFGSDLDNTAKNRGISVDKSFFEIDGHKIYYVFDAPHLIKLVRNNFMTYNFQFSNGSVAKFEHIKKFYEHDHAKPFKQSYKLTNRHINPSNLEKKKVCFATQLLSRCVASGISTYIDLKILDESARHTVDFVLKINDLFDMLNSSTFRHSYPYKCSFSEEDYQVHFLNTMLDFFKTLKLVHPTNGNDVTKTMKFIQGFQITIQSILKLFVDLKQEGHKYLLTRRLNKDIIEKFFGKIRSKNCNDTEPTSRQFISAFREICFANITKLPKGGNCADDLSDFLLKFKDFEPSGEFEILSTSRNEPHNTDNSLSVILRGEYNQMEIPEKNAFYYVCGTLLMKCYNRHGDCELLKSYIEGNQRSCNSGYLIYRDYASYPMNPSLVVPPDDFVKNIKMMEQAFRKKFESNHINNKIGMSIYNDMKNLEFSSPCPCFPKTYLLKLYTRMRIYFSLRSNNKAFKTDRNRTYFSVTNF